MQYLNRYNPIKLRTVTRFTNGIKQYIITAIDLNSKFAFVLPYKTLNSINAKRFMERFNRTIQEQFLQWNLHLIDKPKEFNKKLIEYLLWYTGKRVSFAQF